MNYISGAFYMVKDEFFSYVNDPNLLTNHETGARPHYLSFQDIDTGLILMVPCTSNVTKYRKLLTKFEYEEDNCYNLSQKDDLKKKMRGFRFYNFGSKDSVILFDRMFYVYEGYLDRPYITKKGIATVNPNDYESFQEQAYEVLGYIRNGFVFQRNHPDFERIEKLMLEVKAQKEKTKND